MSPRRGQAPGFCSPPYSRPLEQYLTPSRFSGESFRMNEWVFMVKVLGQGGSFFCPSLFQPETWEVCRDGAVDICCPGPVPGRSGLCSDSSAPGWLPASCPGYSWAVSPSPGALCWQADRQAARDRQTLSRRWLMSALPSSSLSGSRELCEGPGDNGLGDYG